LEDLTEILDLTGRKFIVDTYGGKGLTVVVLFWKDQVK
jgi:S-adenosylmethionine synthetase